MPSGAIYFSTPVQMGCFFNFLREGFCGLMQKVRSRFGSTLVKNPPNLKKYVHRIQVPF